MASALRILEPAIAHLYARALVAIARADDQLGLEEGLRLQHRIDARCAKPIAIDDLLLAEPIDAAALEAIVAASAGPFRGGVHPGELARLIVVDAIEVVLAKGYISEGEAREMIRFAMALGCTLDEVRGMAPHLAPWLGPLR